MQKTNRNGDGGVWKSFPLLLLPIGHWEGNLRPGAGVHCGVGVRIDEKIVTFSASLDCMLSPEQCYLHMGLLSVALASTVRQGKVCSHTGLITAVRGGEHEDHRAEPMFQVLSDEQARVESSPGMPRTRDLKALSE